jgi:Undecaprenyl-phosphate galactose phosphotransferase WbaP
MSVQSSARTEAMHLVSNTLEASTHLSVPTERWAKSGRQSLVKFVLLSSDILLAFAIWQVAFVLESILWGQGSSSGLAVLGWVPNVVVWVGLRAVLSMYPGYGLGQVEELRRQTLATLVTLPITGVLILFSEGFDYVLSVLLLTWALSLLLLAPVARYFVKRTMMKVGLWGKPVLVLGAQEAGAHVLKVLRLEWQLGLKPVAVFDNRIAPAGGTLEGVPYGGTLTDAVALARRHEIDTAIFAMSQTRGEHLAKFVDLARRGFRHVVIIPNLDGVTNCTVVARDLAGMLGVEIKHNLLDPWAQRLKRVLDFVATAVGGLFILPLIVTLTLLVRLESHGPVFYSDKRMGKDGTLFSCIKFRTMVLDAEALLQQILAEDDKAREEYFKYHKLRNDPRVTRVGRFLRKTSLDELPQLWNVLRGEMSLVGPRPYLPRESGDIGIAESEILRVTPGITGPWQVSGRNNTSFEERVQMDVGYVRDWSVYLDLMLLARTVSCLLFGRNAY